MADTDDYPPSWNEICRKRKPPSEIAPCVALAGFIEGRIRLLSTC
jgi:hypothetical protein